MLLKAKSNWVGIEGKVYRNDHVSPHCVSRARDLLKAGRAVPADEESESLARQMGLDPLAKNTTRQENQNQPDDENQKGEIERVGLAGVWCGDSVPLKSDAEVAKESGKRRARGRLNRNRG